MPGSGHESMELLVSRLLRTGVILAGSVGLIGGFFYLASHGHQAVDFRHFQGEPDQDRLAGNIIRGALSFQSRSVVQLGILLLIATPVARVALSLIGFVLEKDRAYIWITIFVLTMLLYSLVFRAIEG